MAKDRKSKSKVCSICAYACYKLIDLVAEDYLEQLVNGGSHDDDGKFKEIGKGGSIPVCEECFGVIGRAVDKRKQAAEMEGYVRDLQLQILKALIKLQGQMKDFYVELQTLEGIIKRGDVACLQTVGNDKQEVAVHFRTKIVEVAKDLSHYRDYLAIKLNCNTSKNCSFPGTEVMETQETFETVRCEPEVKQEVEMEVEEPESDSNFDLDPLYQDDDNESDGSDSEEWSNDNKQQAFSSKSTESSQENKSNEGSPPKKVRASRSNYYNKVLRQTRKYSEAYQQSYKITKDMAPFKQNIIEQVIKRCEMRKVLERENIRGPKLELEGPQYEYNVETQKLMIGDVEVILNEHLQSLHCSKCSHFTAKPENVRWRGVAAMRVHVLGYHLNQFQCKLCQKVMATIASLKSHMKERHPEGVAEPGAICDICGKSFVQAKRLKWHRWTHCSKEEKEEAIAKGEPFVQKVIRKSKPEPKKSQCSECGVLLANDHSLKIHKLRVHAPGKELQKQKAVEGKKKKCWICGKPLGHNRTVRLHVWRHMNQEEKEAAVRNGMYPEKVKEMENKEKGEGEVLIKKKEVKTKKQKQSVDFEKQQCVYCGKMFKKECFLKKHEKRVHKIVN